MLKQPHSPTLAPLPLLPPLPTHAELLRESETTALEIEALANLPHRASTVASHYLSVERVVRALLKDLSASITLEDMADIAVVSPFHFNRIFRAITGVPPLRFLSALRIAEAKRLLLTTHLNVTDACFEVGYNSLGSFSSRFKEFVGISPYHLRQLLKTTVVPFPEGFQAHPAGRSAPATATQRLVTLGRVKSEEVLAGPILVGAFTTPLPQGKPAACAVLSHPGPFRAALPPDGEYYLFAAALRWSDQAVDYTLPNQEQLRVGAGPTPVVVRGGELTNSVTIQLRPLRVIDPPLLVDLLNLLHENGYFQPGQAGRTFGRIDAAPPASSHTTPSQRSAREAL